MSKLKAKIQNSLRIIRHAYDATPNGKHFIAFSGGKDSLAVACLVQEALSPNKIPCVYVHHDMEFPENFKYVEPIAKPHGVCGLNGA